MTESEKKESVAAGWYRQGDGRRYWNGSSWVGAAQMPPRGSSPVGLIVLGVILAIVGGTLFGASLTMENQDGVLSFLGTVVLYISGVVSLVGVIAQGVRVGIGYGMWDRTLPPKE